MLQRMRDEAHRFAITYNRKRRSMRTVTSELLKIKGVGPEKRRALLNAFGSVQGVRDAGVEAIAQLPGFSATSAERLLAALAPQSEAPAASEIAERE
jgi:excinuclease ABC subunit C